MSAESGAREEGLWPRSRRSKTLLEVTFVLGMLHLIDHVLRANHSG